MSSPPRHNNFDAIRLFAALQVVVFHAYEHLGLSGIPALDMLVRVIRHIPGVPIFFVVSGFLISWSFDRKPVLPVYARNRFLRLYPGLWIALAVSIAVMAAQGFIGVASLHDVRFWFWIVAQVSIFQAYTAPSMRGYGLGNPNGSLWTIVVEVQFYVLVPFIHRLRRHRNLVCILVMALSIGMNAFVIRMPQTSTTTKLLEISILPYLFFFLLGSLAYFNWSVIERWLVGRSLWWLAALIGYSIIASDVAHLYEPSYWPNAFGLIAVILLAGTTLSIGFSGARASKLLSGWDISYGIYIYHAIVLNLLVQHRVTGTVESLLLLIGATVVCALASWMLVERPSLRHRTVT